MRSIAGLVGKRFAHSNAVASSCRHRPPAVAVELVNRPLRGCCDGGRRGNKEDDAVTILNRPDKLALLGNDKAPRSVNSLGLFPQVTIASRALANWRPSPWTFPTALTMPRFAP